MDGTILGQGSFVVGASVVPLNVAIPCGADWMKVSNYTQRGLVGSAAAPFRAFEYYWQRGMAAGTGMVSYYNGAVAVISGDTLASGGFTLYDASGNPVGNSVAFSAITNAVRPVVSTASTAGLSVGSVVRLSLQSGDTALASAVCGVDFVVSAVTTNTSFELLDASNELANVPGLTTGTGHYRIIASDPLFYPVRRFITSISQAVNAVVATSVAHGFVAGQQVRFNIPAVSGMVQLNASAQNNYQSATVVDAIDAYSFSINVDSSAFTAFSFPTVAQQPSSFPEVSPLGENSALALASAQPQLPIDQNGNPINNANSGFLSDSTVNTGFIGMNLGVGGLGAITGTVINGPAGSAEGDVVYWLAGKSTFGGL